ncbi:hypothetical protein BDZ85DRAFT_284415 [Elsinoe ampelina]|uniref:Uncharacterized protein n=1 Tax=Elsinoe ampelina TaxID=302913 RepID=A0A6A6G525_9PEZI|nr:hypothetical protein BDZ85DRAFT_284415 [Elsinoe ampelina]
MPVITRAGHRSAQEKRDKEASVLADPSVPSYTSDPTKNVLTRLPTEVAQLIAAHSCRVEQKRGGPLSIYMDHPNGQPNDLRQQLALPPIAAVNRQLRDAAIEAKYREIRICRYSRNGSAQFENWFRWAECDVFSRIQCITVLFECPNFRHVHYSEDGHKAFRNNRLEVALTIAPRAEVWFIMPGDVMSQFPMVEEADLQTILALEAELQTFVEGQVVLDTELDRNFFKRTLMTGLRAILSRHFPGF